MDWHILQDRTKTFAHRCVKAALWLDQSPLASHIKRQLIRCSTSTAANYRAACLAQSKVDFAAKLSIVIEEADECIFWLEFLVDEKLLTPVQAESLVSEAKELAAIFVAARKTVKNRTDVQSGKEVDCNNP